MRASKAGEGTIFSETVAAEVQERRPRRRAGRQPFGIAVGERLAHQQRPKVVPLPSAPAAVALPGLQTRGERRSTFALKCNKSRSRVQEGRYYEYYFDAADTPTRNDLRRLIAKTQNRGMLRKSGGFLSFSGISNDDWHTEGHRLKSVILHF